MKPQVWNNYPARTPDADAAVFEESRLTYRELAWGASSAPGRAVASACS